MVPIVSPIMVACVAAEPASQHDIFRHMMVIVVANSTKAEANAFVLMVREGLQPLLRVLRYRGGESSVRQTVSNSLGIPRWNWVLCTGRLSKLRCLV